MIVIAGHAQGLICRSIASVLLVLPGPKRFVSARQFVKPPNETGVEQRVVNVRVAHDASHALDGARSLVLVANMESEHTELQLALASAARTAGIEKLVLVTLIGADANSPVEILRRLGQVERAVRESGVAHVILRCAPFMQSLRFFMQVEEWSLALSGPFRDAYFHWIDARDVGDIVASLLQGPLDNTVKQLCGPEPLNFDAIAAILCDCAKCDCAFNDLSAPQAQGVLEGAGISSENARALVEYWDYIVSGVVSTTPCDTARKLLGHPLRTLAQCAPTIIPRRDSLRESRI